MTQSTFDPKRILLPTDLTDGCAVAMGVGIDIAARHGSQVDVLNVVRELPVDVYGDMDYFNDDIARRIREQIHGALSGLDIPDDIRKSIRVHTRHGSPAAEIRDFLRDNGNDLTVMATHGRTGLDRLQAGSVTESVLQHALGGSVLAIKPESGRTGFKPRHILVPLDFSDRDMTALTQAKALVGTHGCDVTVIHVVPTFLPGPLGAEMPPSARQAAEERIGELMDAASLNGLVRITAGEPDEEILNTATDHNIDVIVMPARRGKGFFSNLGSVSRKIARLAPCDVLVTPA